MRTGMATFRLALGCFRRSVASGEMGAYLAAFSRRRLASVKRGRGMLWLDFWSWLEACWAARGLDGRPRSPTSRATCRPTTQAERG